MKTDNPFIPKLCSYLDYSEHEPIITASDGSKLISDLIYLLIASKEDKPAASPGKFLIHKVGRILSQNPSSNLNVSELAELADVSREHLTRTFQQYTGRTPLQFITRKKIIDACGLLQEENSIKDVSDSLGYSSPAHFTRTFKRVMGKTPYKFKKDSGIPLFI